MSKSTTLSVVVRQLIAVAQSKGIKFQWATKAEVEKLGKGTLGYYNPRTKCVVVMKGLSIKQTEEVITHEVAHALWDLSLKGKKITRSTLKKMKVETSLPTWLTLIINYWDKKESWKEERFAYYMESKPELVLQLFNQL